MTFDGGPCDLCGGLGALPTTDHIRHGLATEPGEDPRRDPMEAMHMTRGDGIRVSFAFDKENQPEILIVLGACLGELCTLANEMRVLLSTSPIDGVRLESLDAQLRTVRHDVGEAYTALVIGRRLELEPPF